jgi:uncharacterized protein
MKFEWDDDKAEANFRKHGILFSVATTIFEDEFAIEVLDLTMDYGEERWLVVGRSEEGLITVVFTVRGANYRIISARKASKHEKQNYLQQN